MWSQSYLGILQMFAHLEEGEITKIIAVICQLCWVHEASFVSKFKLWSVFSAGL